MLSFVFQAEDGIRDRNVTGVQTCALPISVVSLVVLIGAIVFGFIKKVNVGLLSVGLALIVGKAAGMSDSDIVGGWRSEERRVGNGVRRGGWRSARPHRQRSMEGRSRGCSR